MITKKSTILVTTRYESNLLLSVQATKLWLYSQILNSQISIYPENKTQNITCDFEIKANHQSKLTGDLIVIKKKKWMYQIADFVDPVDLSVK